MDENRVTVVSGELGHQHGIGTAWEDPSRHDAHRLPRTNSHLSRISREDLSN
jgi:hypothetical protein